MIARIKQQYGKQTPKIHSPFYLTWCTRRFLQRSIEVPIDQGGILISPNRGMPRKSSLSSYLAARYIKSLDQHFEHRKDIFYARYNDDIIILCQSKRQFAKAKHKLNIGSVTINHSTTKTWMGAIQKGFHFLGSVTTTSYVEYHVFRKMAEFVRAFLACLSV